MSCFSGIRVVVVAHGPPLKGGIATVASDLVLDPTLNAEFEIVFLNTTQNERARGRLSAENLRRLLSDTWNTFRLARPGTVVHSHSVQAPWPVAWRQVAIAAAARARRARVVLHNHGADPYMEPPASYDPGRLGRWAFAVLDRLVEANVLLSPAGVENLGRWFTRVDLPVIANSVEVADLIASSADHDPPVLLFVGELLERKGVGTLLDAVDRIDRSPDAPSYELRIIGDDRTGLDPSRDEMIREVAARGRGACLVGALSRDEVYRHLGEADVLVLPSEYEGQPFVLIEALAAGVPVIASNLPSIATMIDVPDNGRLVERSDPEALASAVLELLEDPPERRRIGARNRQRALEQFDRAVFRSRIAELYRLHGRP